MRSRVKLPVAPRAHLGISDDRESSAIVVPGAFE
jgi:hypothetical protein